MARVLPSASWLVTLVVAAAFLVLGGEGRGAAQATPQALLTARPSDRPILEGVRTELRAGGYRTSVVMDGESTSLEERLERAGARLTRSGATYAVVLGDRSVWVVSVAGTVRHAPSIDARSPAAGRTVGLIAVGLLDEVERFEAARAAPEVAPPWTGREPSSGAPASETPPTATTPTPTEPTALEEPNASSVTAGASRGDEARAEVDETSAAPSSTEIPPSDDAPALAADAEAENASSEEPVATVQVPSDATAVADAPLSADPPERHLWIGGDVVPFVGTSTITRGRAERRLSFDLFVGLDHSLRGFGLSGLGHVDRRDARGLAISGGFTAQGGDLVGVAFAGIANVTRGQVVGAQVSTLNLALGSIRGAQLGVVNAGFGGLHGVQLGVVNLARETTRGMQLGAVNVATGRAGAVQIGIVNYGRRTRFAFGLLNLVRDGRTQVDILGNDTGMVHAALKHGGDHFHTILSVGVDAFHSPVAAALGLGYGVRATPTRRLAIDLDLVGHLLVDETTTDPEGIESLSSLRLLANVRLARRFGLLFGPSYEVLVSQRANRIEGRGRYGGSTLHDGSASGGPRVFGWPTLVVGIEVL